MQQSLNHDISLFSYPLSSCMHIKFILLSNHYSPVDVPEFLILKSNSLPSLIHNNAGCLAYFSLHSASLVTRHCIPVIQHDAYGHKHRHANVTIASKNIHRSFVPFFFVHYHLNVIGL